MFTNADQLTSGKKAELIQHIEKEKPLLLAVCEMKPKITKERVILDYNIPGYSIHPVNMDPNNNGRGIAVYTHDSIDKSVMQIQPELGFEEVCLLEIRLRGGDRLIFGCIYRSPTPSEKSEENNNNLNNLLDVFRGKDIVTCASSGTSTIAISTGRPALLHVMRTVRKQNLLKPYEIAFSISTFASQRVSVETTRLLL